MKKQQKLVFLRHKTFLAFLALSREKRVKISRISREIKNARNVHVYSLVTACIFYHLNYPKKIAKYFHFDGKNTYKEDKVTYLCDF